MTSREELGRLYGWPSLYLGRPVLERPVKATDIEIVLEGEDVLLSCTRPPRLYKRNLQVRFLSHNLLYFYDGVHQLQVIGGAGTVWRRIESTSVHWRAVIAHPINSGSWIGRPWDWPDRILPLPDPVYDMDPSDESTSYACHTPLVDF